MCGNHVISVGPAKVFLQVHHQSVCLVDGKLIIFQHEQPQKHVLKRHSNSILKQHRLSNVTFIIVDHTTHIFQTRILRRIRH